MRTHQRVRAISALCVILFGVVVGFTTYDYADLALAESETPPLPVPPAPGTNPDSTAFDQAISQYESSKSQHSISEFSIVIFSPDSRIEQSVLADGPMTSLQNTLQARVEFTWDAVFENFREGGSIDVLLFDSISIDRIRPKQAQELYRAGTLFIGFETTHEQMRQLTGDYCVSDGANLAPFVMNQPHYLLYFYFAPPFSDPTAMNSEMSDCASDNSQTTEIAYSRGYLVGLLGSPASESALSNQLVDILFDRHR